MSVRQPGPRGRDAAEIIHCSEPPGRADETRLYFGNSRANRRGTLLSMRVLGIDCGTECTGYGVVDLGSDGTLFCVIYGAIKLSPREAMAWRLATVFERLGAVIAEHQPDNVAIEDVFYAANAKSAIKLGQVRGVAMLAASSAGLNVAEYSPLSIKSSVVGYGRAEKQQVQQMVMRLLNLAEAPEPNDAADALAIAICHLHTSATQERQQAAAK